MRPKIYVEFTTFSASFRVLSSYELCVTLPKRTELCQIRQFRMKERGLYHRVSDKLRRVLFSGSKAIISQYSCKNSVEPSFFFFYIFYDFLFQGEIECELYWKQSPRTCKNFAELVSSRASYNIN